jgi:hypothetical protein
VADYEGVSVLVQVLARDGEIASSASGPPKADNDIGKMVDSQ